MVKVSIQFSTKVGSNIKKYRKEKGLTLKELAEKVNLTEATVQKYETGSIKTLDIIKLKTFSDALDIELENLTEWKKELSEKTDYVEQGIQEAKIMKMYSKLTSGHKKAVQSLIENLLECQERYSSDK